MYVYIEENIEGKRGKERERKKAKKKEKGGREKETRKS